MSKETIRISELPSDSEYLNGEEEIEIASPSSGLFRSLKMSFSNFGHWLFNIFHFDQLQTNNKTIIGAINELTHSETALCGPGAGPHNAVYRGKCLGTSPTQEQYNAIYNGSFDNLYIGDYWYDPQENIHWRIAGFNYYQGWGDTYDSEAEFTKYTRINHAVIMPDECLVGDTYEDLAGIIRSTAIYADKGYASSGSLRISELYGIKAAKETFTIDYVPQMGERYTYTFHLQHEPYKNASGFALAKFNIVENGVTYPCIYRFASSVSNQDVQFSIYYYRRNTGTTSRPVYVIYSGLSNYNVLRCDAPGSQHFPSQVIEAQYDPNYSIMYLPLGTEIEIFYRYQDENVGAMKRVENIVENKFGNEHIVPMVYGGYCSEPREKVTLPSSECLFGHSVMTTSYEYRPKENGDEWAEKYWFNGNYADANHNSGAYFDRWVGILSYTGMVNNNNNPRSNTYRLPVFFYNPALTRNGYGYWLNNYYSTTPAINNPQEYYMDKCETRMVAMDERGNQVADTSYGARPRTGIRPIFCISATNDYWSIPEEEEEENE